MDGLEQIQTENPSDSKYFRALLAGIKEMAIQVNTHDSMKVKAKKNQDILLDPPLPKKQKTDFPKKQKTDQSKQLKKEAVVPPVTTQNKFQVLSNLEDGENTTASTSSEQNVADMDISDPTEATVNSEQIPNVPRTKKGPRPPPVTVIVHSNLLGMNRELKKIIQGDLKFVSTQEGLRYYTYSVEDHRKLKDFFANKNLQYYTLQLKSELPLRVMLKKAAQMYRPGGDPVGTSI